MLWLRTIASVLLPSILLALSGCGDSSSSGNFNPVPASDPVSAASPSTPSFSNTSSAKGKYAINLSVDRTSIDANVGQVLATATITSSDDASIADRLVTFSVAAGPATVDPGLVTVSTDSNGKAVSIIAPGNVLTTTNVILVATTTINGTNIRAYAPVQIVRGTGVITFITTKQPTDPDGTLFTLDKTVEANFAGVHFEFMQQLPFKLTDANGNPRVGVPVTVSIDNQLTNLATISLNKPTVITDSAGKGIFNVGVVMTAPPQGITHTDSIIYKAVTTEVTGTPPLSTYAGFVVSMTSKSVPLAISPSTAGFGASTDINFAISGGLKPYVVSSSNGALVSATLQADGLTVIAHLADSSSWTTSVKISVTDAAGNTASATVSR